MGLKGKPVSEGHRGLLQKGAGSHMKTGQGELPHINQRIDKPVPAILIINLKGTREAIAGHARHCFSKEGNNGQSLQSFFAKRSDVDLPTLSQFWLHLQHADPQVSRVCVVLGSQQLNLWLK